jgi:hypothetical protein
MIDYYPQQETDLDDLSLYWNDGVEKNYADELRQICRLDKRNN